MVAETISEDHARIPLDRNGYGSKCLVAWCRIQRPPHIGGLGVIDLRLLGVALRAGWLWLHRIDPARAWTSRPSGEDNLTKAFFDASIQLWLSDGATFLFWTDLWLAGARLADLAPDLVAATSNASRRRRRYRTSPGFRTSPERSRSPS
jgi:hypothetical protein